MEEKFDNTDDTLIKLHTFKNSNIDFCQIETFVHHDRPEQEYMLEHIQKCVDYGFDGVSLIFIRGIHIGFEQPVLDRFEELYPGVNPELLPVTDKRLHGVWCEFLTEFMRELRNRLEPHIKINVLTDYGLTTSKHMGLDVEAWASQGLIDSASQSDMETYEDLDGCLSDDGTIDMEKYIKKSQNTEIIRRNFGTRPDIAFSHIKEYLDLEQYGIDVYHIMPWVHRRLEEFNDYINKMKKLGVKKFHSWNTNHMAWNLSEYNSMRFINNENKKVDDILTYYRTLSLNGSDISSFNPNWKG